MLAPVKARTSRHDSQEAAQTFHVNSSFAHPTCLPSRLDDALISATISVLQRRPRPSRPTGSSEGRCGGAARLGVRGTEYVRWCSCCCLLCCSEVIDECYARDRPPNGQGRSNNEYSQRVVPRRCPSIIAGCQDTEHVWVKDGASQQDFNMDAGECKDTSVRDTRSVAHLFELYEWERLVFSGQA